VVQLRGKGGSCLLDGPGDAWIIGSDSFLCWQETMWPPPDIVAWRARDGLRGSKCRRDRSWKATYDLIKQLTKIFGFLDIGVQNHVEMNVLLS
jgi:hypothetical protein